MAVGMYLFTTVDDELAKTVQSDEGCHFNGITPIYLSYSRNLAQIRNCARLEQYWAEQSTLISASDEVTVDMDLYVICGDDTYGAMQGHEGYHFDVKTAHVSIKST